MSNCAGRLFPQTQITADTSFKMCWGSFGANIGLRSGLFPDAGLVGPTGPVGSVGLVVVGPVGPTSSGLSGSTGPAALGCCTGASGPCRVPACLPGRTGWPGWAGSPAPASSPGVARPTWPLHPGHPVRQVCPVLACLLGWASWPGRPQWSWSSRNGPAELAWPRQPGRPDRPIWLGLPVRLAAGPVGPAGAAR